MLIVKLSFSLWREQHSLVNLSSIKNFVNRKEFHEKALESCKFWLQVSLTSHKFHIQVLLATFKAFTESESTFV